jgi:glycosyltransferase involved in cell wall biosynthesis
VVAVSGALAVSLRNARVSPEKITVIDNGIDFDSFLSARPSADLENVKAGRLAIGLVGRLTEQKGHAYLFKAMKEILAICPQLVVLVIGDGPLKEELEALAEQLGIAANVIFVGKRSDMASVYAALDIVAMPSLYEGMPIVLLEALAAKRAVVVTRVGAVPEIVRNETMGLLIEPADTMALRNAIQRLIADAGLRRSLGENGYAFAREHFSAASMAGKYRRVYEAANQ